MKNYYQILGLEEGATLDEIKAAYKKYAAKFHPDKHGDDEFFKERFQEIQEAYEYLLNHYEDNRAESENKYILTIDNIVLFECNPQQVQVGDTIIIKWQINHECKCTLEIDNGYSIYTYGEKQIKVNRIRERITITLRIFNDYSNADKSITISERVENKMKNFNESGSDKNQTSSNGTKKRTLTPIVMIFLLILIPIMLLMYYAENKDNTQIENIRIKNAMDELESCQNFDAYKKFVDKYIDNENIVINELVEEASVKMENTKIKAYKISYFYHKRMFYDATKISSIVLYVDYEQQKIIMKDSRKGVVMDIDYVYTDKNRSSNGVYDYFYYGNDYKKIEISISPNYLYHNSAYYKILIDNKLYLSKESSYVTDYK